MSTASPLTMVASGQPRVSHSVEDTTVAGMRIVRMFHSSSEFGSRPEVMISAFSRKGGGPEDHPLPGVEQGGAVLEQLGACLPQ